MENNQLIITIAVVLGIIGSTLITFMVIKNVVKEEIRSTRIALGMSINKNAIEHSHQITKVYTALHEDFGYQITLIRDKIGTINSIIKTAQENAKKTNSPFKEGQSVIMCALNEEGYIIKNWTNSPHDNWMYKWNLVFPEDEVGKAKSKQAIARYLKAF